MGIGGTGPALAVPAGLWEGVAKVNFANKFWFYRFEPVTGFRLTDIWRISTPPCPKTLKFLFSVFLPADFPPPA